MAIFNSYVWHNQRVSVHNMSPVDGAFHHQKLRRLHRAGSQLRHRPLRHGGQTVFGQEDTEVHHAVCHLGVHPKKSSELGILWESSNSPNSLGILWYLRSGNLLRSYWKWPLIVDFPIETGDFP